ncbi:hypothetical protein SAMN06296273_1891 [Nitrosomonas ureae]|uniref:Uncharacterized protein n=1 Tax=Nitrosomonas ureae TaxID=44577 RepID=A0A285BYN5_9PROT|nr:hypothetical protein [Nitrosomonas ureae]SNX60424.1 hypothetical protein SAMN06296273_1891 [Nitrosomonas ureae]
MTKQTLKGKYLYFTEEANAIDYLERAGEFISQVMTDENAWKWVMLSLHGALYGFAIAACKGSDYQSVVKISRKGHERLITLDEALEMCKDASWMGTLHGGLPLNLSDSQKDSIKQLKETLRNSFEHYIPGGWSIELHGLPRISIDIIDVIYFLAIETFRYQHLNQKQREKIKFILFQSKGLLQKSPLHLELLAAERANGAEL